MEHDDDQIGEILPRREVLTLLGAAGASLFGVGYAPHPGPRASRFAYPSCIVRPEQTEGPYFVDEQLNRSDIRPDPSSGAVPEGVRLDLEFQVSRMRGNACTPLADALVDVWQCDALGVYSGVRDANGRFDTVGRKFLRGHQRTGNDGTARFVTIYPGWYEGRTVHIHFKIRTARGGTTYDFTSQLYFDDALTDRVLEREPYARKGPRTVRNARDGIFRRGGDQLMLAVRERGDGHAATFGIGLQLD
jgi:protocatechuate 3,4-dioxygenase beta subunit